MTAPDLNGPPCEYCQMPQAEDNDGYGFYWSCQNPNCKNFLGYIRELERAARARAPAMAPEVRALVEAAERVVERMAEIEGSLTFSKRSALDALGEAIAALRGIGGDP